MRVDSGAIGTRRTWTLGGRSPSRNAHRLLMSAVCLVLTIWDLASTHAQPLVNAVDWVQGRPEVPHPAIQSKHVILQGIAEEGACDGRYQFRWDVNGDGDFNDGEEHWRHSDANGHRGGYFAPLGIQYTFPNQPGDRIFYPAVEVKCWWGGPTAKKSVPYLLRVDRMCSGYPPQRDSHFHSDLHCEGVENESLTRNYTNDWAVDRALWWMFNRMSHHGHDGRGTNVHSCVYWGNHSLYGQGHMLNAFLRRSHGRGVGHESDVYYRHAVECGMNTLLATYEYACDLHFDDNGAHGRDGCRLYKHDAHVSMGDNWMAYGSTAWTEPAAGYGDPDYVSRRHGTSMRALAQDLSDGLVYCQGDNGGWYYSCRGDGPDGSTNGWAPEGLRLLNRKYGAETYNWARDRQREWLLNHCRDNCSYHGGGPKLSGNALVGYGWVYEENYQRGSSQGQLGRHYDNVSTFDHVHWGSYYMYASTKGLRSWDPELTYLSVNDPRFGTPGCTADKNNCGGRDWAAEFSEFITSWQAGDGSFEWCYADDGSCHHNWLNALNRECITALETQIVQSWLEAQAIARADPQQTGPRVPVDFDHSWSYVLDPSIKIIRYRWDIDGRDGLWWETGAAPDFESDECADNDSTCLERIRTTQYAYTYDDDLGWDDVIGTRATLQIEDSVGRKFVDDKSVEVELSLKNHRPIIVPHPDGRDGIYTGYFGRKMMFDASLTWDADECVRDDAGFAVKGNCGNRFVFPGNGNQPQGIPEVIKEICFDIDFDGNWCEAGEIAGPKTEPTIIDDVAVHGRLGELLFVPGHNLDAGTTVGIPIRACDDGRWNGRCYQPGDGAPANLTKDDCSKCAYGTVSVSVVQNVSPPTLEIEPPAQSQSQALVRITGSPDSGQTFSITDHTGAQENFVFDRLSDTVDGAVQFPTARIEVTGNPASGQTFTLTDRSGTTRRFIFNHGSQSTDGSTQLFENVDHVTVGIFGALNDLDSIAERMDDAIRNTGDLRLTTRLDGNTVVVEEGNPAALPSAEVQTAGLSNTDLSPFQDGRATMTFLDTPGDEETFTLVDHRGTTRHFVFDRDSQRFDGTTRRVDGVPHAIIGLRSLFGLPEEVLRRTMIVIDAAGNLRFQLRQDGATLIIEENEMTAASIPLDTSGVTGLSSQPFQNDKASIEVNAVPLDEQTFQVWDNRGRYQDFVFDHDSAAADGSTAVIDERPHIIIGLQGATHSTTAAAERIGEAIGQAGNIEVSAQTDENRLELTQEVPAQETMPRVDLMDAVGLVLSDFVTGTIVGIDGVEDDPEGIATRTQAAIDANGNLDVEIERQGANIVMTQNVFGFDGNQVIDFSLVDNIDAPEAFLGGHPGGYVAQPGQPVQLDFSRSRDPENVVGLETGTQGIRFKYRLPQGGGIIQPTPGYENRPDNLGARPFFIPDVDGLRIIPIEVIAQDIGGMETINTVEVTVLNAPPTISGFQTSFSPRKPTVTNQVHFENLGNRRYRATIEAFANPGWNAFVDYEAQDGYGEALTAQADMDGDGAPDLAANDAAGRLGPFIYTRAGGRAWVTLNVDDGEDTASMTLPVEIPPNPPGALALSYDIDMGADGVFEALNRRSGQVEFLVTPGQTSVRFVGTVRAENFATDFDTGEVQLPNAPPRLNLVRVISVDGFDVKLSASAHDTDGDPITYTIDWGDGSAPTRTEGIVTSHQYPAGQYAAYDIVVTADDGRGGDVEGRGRVEILEPEILQANLGALRWERKTEIEGRYDGVRSLAIGRDGAIFIHNYLDEVRRSTDEGETWETILADFECCGAIVTGTPGQVFASSPAGLLYSDNNGDDWELWSESKFGALALSFDGSQLIAASGHKIYRFGMTGDVSDVHNFPTEIVDAESCASSPRMAAAANDGRIWINDHPTGAPAGWRIPAAQFGKAEQQASVSFDAACNLYQGAYNGYRIYTYPDGPVSPASTGTPNHLIHPAGYHRSLIARGTGYINDILAWDNGPAIIGSSRGIWGTEEPWNAHRSPYWEIRTNGVDRSNFVRKFAIDPKTGYAYLATSSATEMPKYCRKAANRRTRRRRRRGFGGGVRSKHYYVFCGFTYNFTGGVYRSVDTLLTSKNIGRGGSPFKTLNASGSTHDAQRDALVVDVPEDGFNILWLPNTAESTVSRWRMGAVDNQPVEVGRFRVGRPEGECPGQCCFDQGCNMPSRVAVDGQGNAYIASAGFGMQGSLTKIAGNLNQCEDRNGNGEIETSNTDQAKDYETDECVLWTADVGGFDALLRSLVIDGGDAHRAEGYPWVGAFNDSKVYKLDPETGQVLMAVDVDVQPFGSVIDRNGHIWLTTLGDAQLQSIDSQTGAVGPVIQNPEALREGCESAFGTTIDPKGRIWLSGWECPDAIGYDPATQTWCRIKIPGDALIGRGITTDKDGRIWAAIGGDGQSALTWWDMDRCEPNQTFDLTGRGNRIESPPNALGPTAISADGQGRVWLAHYLSSTILSVNPNNLFAVQSFEGTNQVFSFSDTNGLTRHLAVGRGTYFEDIEADCDGPTWSGLSWEADVPLGAKIQFEAATANMREQLDSAAQILMGENGGVVLPVNMSGRFAMAGVDEAKFVRVKVTMTKNLEGVSPALHHFTVFWTCND